VDRVLELRGEVQEAADAFARGAVAEPILVTPMAPGRDVLLIDGISLEGAIDQLFGFVEGIEPRDEILAPVAVEETGVEFVPDFVRETCDFTDS